MKPRPARPRKRFVVGVLMENQSGELAWLESEPLTARRAGELAEQYERLGWTVRSREL